MNKKADVTDMLTVAFWLLVIAIGIIAVMLFSFKIITPLKGTVLGEDNRTLSALNSFENYASYGFPGAFIVIFFGLLMGVLVSSFFVRSHPIFLTVYIIFALVSIIAVVPLANVWGYLKDVTEFNDIIQRNAVTQLMDLIMSHLVLVTFAIFILSIVVIFAKPGGGSSGNTPY